MEGRIGRGGLDSRLSHETMLRRNAILSALTPQEVAWAFAGITQAQYGRFIRAGIIVPVKDVVADYGYHINPASLKEFRGALDGLVAVGTLVEEVKSGRQKGFRAYYFIRCADTSDAVGAWSNTQSLQHYKNSNVLTLGGGWPR